MTDSLRTISETVERFGAGVAALATTAEAVAASFGAVAIAMSRRQDWPALFRPRGGPCAAKIRRKAKRRAARKRGARK